MAWAMPWTWDATAGVEAGLPRRSRLGLRYQWRLVRRWLRFAVTATAGRWATGFKVDSGQPTDETIRQGAGHPWQPAGNDARARMGL